MSNKTLRILIADEQHFHRMKIERALNQMGYYRIAPVATLDELLCLLEYGSEPFDLLIFNGELSAQEQLGPLMLCQDNPQVLHAFIYNYIEQSNAPGHIQCSKTALPESALLEQLMSAIAPPAAVRQTQTL